MTSCRPTPSVPWPGSWIRAPGRSIRARTARRARLRRRSAQRDDRSRARPARATTTPPRRSAFLDGELPGHDPFLLGDMAAARSTTIKRAIAAGKRICVHGDYDADGICATALAVLILRELGADVVWHLPSRFEEGYGVQRETLARLADEGCGLVLTVDCGVTAVEEVAEARARGLEVVVTDHHRPGETLPDCPVVATRPFGLPVPRALRHGCRLQARRGAPRPGTRSARAAPRPRRARDDLRRRPAGRREPRACARGPAHARADAEAGPARADEGRARRSGARRRGRRRLPARAADQRVGPALPTRVPRSSCCSPRTRTRPAASRTSSRS